MNKQRVVRKLFTAAAVSLLIGSTAANAEGGKTSGAANSLGEVTAQQFEQVDRNRSGSINWSELESVYQHELTNSGLTQEQIFQEYDQNRNSELEQQEYSSLISGLVTERSGQTAISGEGENRQQDAVGYSENSDIDPAANADSAVSQSAPQNHSPEDYTWDADEQPMQNEPAPIIDGGLVDAGPSTQPQNLQDLQAQEVSASTQAEAVDPGNVTVVDEPAVAAGPNIDVKSIKNRSVVSVEGDQLGKVKDVVVRADGSEAGLVVDLARGSVDVDKDVFVSINEVSAAGEQIVWESPVGQQSLQNLPEYDQEQFISISEQDA